MKSKFLKEVLDDILFLIVVVFFSFLFIHFVGQRTQVSGESMEPTLMDGDNLITDKITYRFQDPKRFDIIVFPVSNMDATHKSVPFIKRIIGLPGESVFIDENGRIFINGEQLIEGYGKEVIAPQYRGRAEQEILLKEEEYFVLGDNRNNSMDSRNPVVGNIKREKIIGRAWLRFWPFDKFGVLKHE